MTDKPATSTIDSGRLAASGDRATDAPHGAAKASPPSGSVSTGAVEFSDFDILEMAEDARRAIVAQPAGFLVDPGAGSAMDRFQRTEPTVTQCGDMARRGGNYETLYTGTSVEKMILFVVRAALAKARGEQP